jgi:hypothetical protein
MGEEMKIFKGFGRKKGRKYPVKRDGNGKSARQRCFGMFKEKVPLQDIAKVVGVDISTVYKYYQQWKKNPEFVHDLSYYKFILDKSAPDRERSIEVTAGLLGMTKEEVETILHQPYGLRRLLSGKMYFPVQADAAHKRYIALKLAVLISDHLLKKDGKLDDVYFAFRRWMKEYQGYREERDESITEENERILLLRKVMEADLENERRGRVKPERLSAEEIDVILKWGVQSAAKKAEIMYWVKIAEIMAEGMTIEQAREKIYQDLLDKGDIDGAKKVRDFQNKVHPSKKDNQQPPSTPKPPLPA